MRKVELMKQREKIETEYDRNKDNKTEWITGRQKKHFIHEIEK